MLLGIFIGLVLGMLIALGVVWYLRQAPLPFEDKYRGAEPAAPAGAEPRTLPLPGKDISAEKPRFDFYGILEGKNPPPGGEPAAPKPEAPAPTPPVATKPAPTPPAATPATAPATAGTHDTLFLQAGAFQKAAEADNLRAKLTLLGFETMVVEADIPDKGHVWRVRTGPYGSPESMNRARQELAQNGIQATMVRAQ